MREIKFRAWDKERKLYDKNHHIWITLDGDILNQQDGAGNDVYILEQYSGLKDKNGKEIYEGDVVAIKHVEQPYGGEVYYDSELARFAIKDKNCVAPLNFIGVPLNKQNPYEIIGNIYENPELLEIEGT